MRRADIMDAEEETRLRRLERIKFLSSHVNQLQQQASTFEHTALRTLILLNGGALVVIFAFLGGSVEPRMDLNLARVALVCWALGLLCAGAVACLGYLSQVGFYHASGQHLNEILAHHDGRPKDVAGYVAAKKSFHDEAKTDRNWAHGLGAVSLLLFLFGIFWSVLALAEATKN